MVQKSIQIKLESGLEARPVAMLVQVASQFESSVYINADDKKVNAKSIMGMMSLGLDSGSEVLVVANGSDEEAAVTEIETFLSGRTAS
jgi:catabolite repression HPr-like protein